LKQLWTGPMTPSRTPIVELDRHCRL